MFGGFDERGAMRFWTKRRRTFAGAALALVSLAGVGSVMACSKDEAAAPARSRRGESCLVGSDCADGLACSPVGGTGPGATCVTGEFKVMPTAKECALIECNTSLDCCSPNATSADCAMLKTRCANEPGGTDCQNFERECGCFTNTVECLGTKCVTHCNENDDCTLRNAGTKCAGGNCAGCILDADCGGGQACVGGRCQIGCTNDADCSGFDRCLGGRCIASGCQTDRECVAATRNVDARCGTDGKCIIPCQTDLECGSPTDYAFYSCIDQQCTFVGCETDKDCGFLYFGASGAAADATTPQHQHAVCKDKGVSVVTPTP